MKPEYQTFLTRHSSATPVPLPDIYHAVRNIPYGSTGERNPVKIIANHLGSCSGKHILLRDLIRETGGQADVITMLTHFNRGIPVHPDMPEDLRRMIEGEDISDFHHYVLVQTGQGNIKLDATWHDALIPYGFRVNDHWDGRGDTTLAAVPIKEYGPVEDIAGLKVKLLGELPANQRDLRARFFRRLTAWMMAIPQPK
jgi:hypothetical protein